MSLAQLITKTQLYLEDKIFELMVRDTSEKESQSFKFVQLKMKKIKMQTKGKKHRKEGILIQMIDMSEKMLYNEVKAEQAYLTMINAAVSHELRNPLNSLIG